MMKKKKKKKKLLSIVYRKRTNFMKFQECKQLYIALVLMEKFM